MILCVIFLQSGQPVNIDILIYERFLIADIIQSQFDMGADVNAVAIQCGFGGLVQYQNAVISGQAANSGIPA